jgi:hypothetical protein
MTPKFFEILDRIDELFSCSPRSISFNDALRPLLENKHARRYFYDKLPSPEWLSYMYENGVYSGVSDTDGVEEAMPSPWYELYPLLKFGSYEPTLTMEILRAVPRTDNHYVREQELRVAQELVEATPKGFKEWLADEISRLNSAEYIHPNTLNAAVDLVITLSGMDCGTASRLAYAVLHSSPPDTESKKMIGALRTDEWNFDEELGRCLSQISSTCGLHALELAVSLLEGLASKEYINTRALLACPNLETASIEQSSDLVLKLVGAARKVAESLAARIGLEVVRFLESRDFATTERIALHVRCRFPSVDPRGTELIIDDHSRLANSYLRGEMVSLFSSQFKRLRQDTLARYFGFVKALPSKEEQRAYLEPIREKLSREWSEYLEAIEAELPVTGTEEVGFRAGGVWVGPTSPFSVEQMRELSTEELVHTLNSWNYKPGWRAHEPEGLARELAAFAAQDSMRVSAQAAILTKLERPTYVRGIIRGLADAVKEEQSISWEPVLRLCKWAVEQERGEGPEGSGLEGFDHTWEPARKQIAWILERGTKKSSAQIPFEYSQLVWSILKELIVDQNPTVEEEADRAQYSDPSTIAINTVRGVALSAVFSYALWVACHNPQDTRSWNTFDLGKVRSVLEARLSEDTSPAVRSVFGKWLPYLFWLDQEWTEKNVGRILPLEEKSKKLWTAVWEAYLMFPRTIYLEFLALLKPSYERALDMVGIDHPEKTRPAKPDERLGNHLVLFYRHRELDRTDSLLERFFERADSRLRYSVLVDAVRQIQEISESDRADVVKRLCKLWEWRCKDALNEEADDYHELSSFAWWFLKDDFETNWRLEQLRLIQEKNIKLELDGRVLEKLVELAEEHLPEVITCLKAIAENQNNTHWGIYDDHAKAILRKGLASSDPAIHDCSENLVHYIGSLGFLSFRGLLANSETEDAENAE